MGQSVILCTCGKYPTRYTSNGICRLYCADCGRKTGDCFHWSTATRQWHVLVRSGSLKFKRMADNQASKMPPRIRGYRDPRMAKKDEPVIDLVDKYKKSLLRSIERKKSKEVTSAAKPHEAVFIAGFDMSWIPTERCLPEGFADRVDGQTQGISNLLY